MNTGPLVTTYPEPAVSRDYQPGETFGVQACRLLDCWPRTWCNCIKRRPKWWRLLWPHPHILHHADIGYFKIYWYGRVQHRGVFMPLERDAGTGRESFHVRRMSLREQLQFWRLYRQWRRLPFDLNALPIPQGARYFGP